MRRTQNESAPALADNPETAADSGADLGSPVNHAPKVRTLNSRKRTATVAERGSAGHTRVDTHARNVGRAKKQRGPRSTDDQTRYAASSEEGHSPPDILSKGADLASLCDSLRALQVRRRFLIRSKDRNRLAFGSLVRRQLGWRADLPEKEREKIRKEAATLIERALSGDSSGAEAWIGEFAFKCEEACAPFDRLLVETEKDMIAAAKQLPAAEWVDKVRGFGIKTLAILVGEAGDIGSYANPGKLWKRLGLAPKDTYAQADNGKYMVPRQRRAEVWACLGDSLLRGNTDRKTGEVGIYKLAYDAKKAEYESRIDDSGEPWSKMHAHKAAHRFMEKLAIKHLWQAWRGRTVLDDPVYSAALIHSPEGDGSAREEMDNQVGSADPTIPPSVAGAGHHSLDTQVIPASASNPRKGRRKATGHVEPIHALPSANSSPR